MGALNHTPKSGYRQPRLRYKIGAPGTEDIEALRQLAGFHELNGVYMEALQIGARILLERAKNEGLTLAPPATTIGAGRALNARAPADPPVKVRPVAEPPDQVPLAQAPAAAE
jgi:hypothetical protein